MAGHWVAGMSMQIDAGPRAAPEVGRLAHVAATERVSQNGKNMPKDKLESQENSC
jgi:hypothetical protein